MRNTRSPFSTGQVLAAEVGHLIPVEVRRTLRAADRDAFLPAGIDEVRFEDGEYRGDRRAGGLAQHTAPPGDITRERVLVAGRDASPERLRVQHEDPDGVTNGRTGVADGLISGVVAHCTAPNVWM